MATKEGLRTPAVEDYTKAIFSLESRSDEPVPTNALADRLGITPGSVSAMLKRLDELGLTTHVPYRGVRLTPAGRRIALEVIRHHRLLESYLADVLGMPWDRVHAEAEVLEHVLSDDLEALIADKLGHPTVDPHGDPIPTVEYDLLEADTVRLDELPIGARGRFVRVSDSDPEMLRYLADQGIALGAELEVVDRQPFGGPLFVRFGKSTHPLGDALTRAMRVEPQEPLA
ncbi:MAG: metal-dependent transcriptional regulator [Solirubrobacteraceae bacterium]